MRKWISVLVVVFIAIVGIGLAATYEAPEFEIFLFNQKIDQDLIDSKYQLGIMKEEILNQLQPAISELIAKGQTFDQSADLTDTFTIFNEMKEKLTIYVEDVGPEIDELIKQLSFNSIEQRELISTRSSTISQGFNPISAREIRSPISFKCSTRTTR